MSEILLEIDNTKSKQLDIGRIGKWIARFIKKTDPLIKEATIQALSKVNINAHNNLNFSPIYDSGCCFGRELVDVKINRMLKDHNEFNAFIGNKGKTEIYWKGEKNKQSHFQLVQKLIYRDESVKNIIRELISKLDIDLLRNFITQIDKHIPSNFLDWKIPDNRKELIVKIVTLRKQKMLDLIK